MNSIRLAVLVASISSVSFLSAQVAHGGEPMGWQQQLDRNNIALVDLGKPQANLVKMVWDQAQEQQAAASDFSYGFQRFVQTNVLTEGTWSNEQGVDVCRLRLKSKDAVMMSVQFDQFELAPGDKVFLSSPKHDRYLGSFTEENMNPSGGLSTAVLPGNEVVIEFHRGSVSLTGRSRLRVASITHGVRNIFKFEGVEPVEKDYYPGFSAANCHNNVVCPIAAGWQAQASSAAMFLRPDGNGCSGVLLNNTANDGKPYFLIANHCNASGYGSWVFYFNYNAPACVGDAGNTDDTMSGCTLRAAFYNSDFALVELFNAPPASYNVYYSGWDRSNAQPTSTAAILHPLYDVKKITFDYQAPNSFFGGYGSNMWGTNWDSGIIEAVGSGCPLYDQNKRVIGNMTGAYGGCGNLGGGQCSKFADQWNGTAPHNRLSDWLDPINSGTTVLDGTYTGTPPQPTVSIALKVFLGGAYEQSTGLMRDGTRSVMWFNEPYAGLGFNHVGEGGGETLNSSVLSATGATAIVDWIFIELRHKNNASNVINTRSALIRRDGRIVEVDGVSDISLGNVTDQYYVAVRHRNHLGVMTAGPVSLSANTPLIDLTIGTVPLYGSQAMQNVGGVQAMWSGDVSHDGEIRYTGTNNDRDIVLQRIGGTVPTATVNGYFTEDVNMDGTVSYTGSGNDRDPILVNVGGAVPTATRSAQLP